VARKLRIQYPGAIYHVINRGNYRRDLFESEGSSDAFLRALFEAAQLFDWKVHAYVVMRNHFHIAVETPSPSLVEGMHWLQSTLATRFNRFRQESGHLFQGRYKSILVQDYPALARVVDYIHLNPVRARVVTADLVRDYPWSSLAVFLERKRPAGLVAAEWLHARGGWADDSDGWRAYEAHLIEIGRDEAGWEKAGLTGLSSGWALGTKGWREMIAKEHAQRSLGLGFHKDEVTELRESAWQESLNKQLRLAGKTTADLPGKPKRQPWKVELARQIRNESGASMPWLAEALQLGKAASLRSYLSRSARTSIP
jgi:REP element-mobilizing transposase RayT